MCEKREREREREKEREKERERAMLNWRNTLNVRINDFLIANNRSRVNL